MQEAKYSAIEIQSKLHFEAMHVTK